MSVSRFAICFLGAAFIATPHKSLAADCPDLKLGQDETQQFCAEFRELLYAPFQPGGNRQVPGVLPSDVDRIIQSDALWGEVYRSDPKQTLDLINRIRSAGGLDGQ